MAPFIRRGNCHLEFLSISYLTCFFLLLFHIISPGRSASLGHSQTIKPCTLGLETHFWLDSRTVRTTRHYRTITVTVHRHRLLDLQHSTSSSHCVAPRTPSLFPGRSLDLVGLALVKFLAPRTSLSFFTCSQSPFWGEYTRSHHPSLSLGLADSLTSHPQAYRDYTRLRRGKKGNVISGRYALIGSWLETKISQVCDKSSKSILQRVLSEGWSEG